MPGTSRGVGKNKDFDVHHLLGFRCCYKCYIVHATENTAEDLIHPKRQRSASWVPEDVGSRGWALSRILKADSSEDPHPLFPGRELAGMWQGEEGWSFSDLSSFVSSWSEILNAEADTR